MHAPLYVEGKLSEVFFRGAFPAQQLVFPIKYYIRSDINRKKSA